jgi:DNA-binding HxlR family transcriptional regulator
MADKKRRSDCPISTALDIFGDKWTLLIVRDLMFKGKQSYGEFLNSEEKIATNILADRLQLLERSGIINKAADPSHGAKFIYKLSAKGIDLLPVLVEIILWSATHDVNTAADRQFVEEARDDKVKLLRKISLALTEDNAT